MSFIDSMTGVLGVFEDAEGGDFGLAGMKKEGTHAPVAIHEMTRTTVGIELNMGSTRDAI
jgi:hypothetical protein